MKKKAVLLFSGLPQEVIEKAQKKEQPAFIPPMLATLTEDYFSSKDWLYEHKFDGVRCLAFKKKGKVHLISRNNKSMNTSYPEIVNALESDKADNFIIDGEIISVGKKGISDFQLLQGRMNVKVLEKIVGMQKLIRIKYCIFDLIYVDGFDVRSFPLIDRKKVLKKLLQYNRFLSYSTHKVGSGIAYFKYACKKGWEGLIAKHKDSVYVGARSSNWLKFKCVMDQELVIGGYTQPQGARSDFGALLVGYYKNGKFMYAGKVGTGFSEDTLSFLGKKLRKLEIKRCPFSNFKESTQGVHWVKPHLVGEFGFAEWTRQGKLRVGRYRGLREDKSAQDVVRERPKAIGIKKK